MTKENQTKTAGIKAVNQQYKQYEQVNKDQVYGLTELDGVDEFDDEFEVKTCDIGQWLHGGEAGKARFAQEFGSALEEIGFAIIVGHDVDVELYGEAEAKIAELFEEVPLDERMPYLAKRQGSVNQGYFPINETTIIHPDLVEGWVFCRRAFNLGEKADYNERDYWPRTGFEPSFRKVIKAHEGLIKPLMQSMLMYLGCDVHHYDEALSKTNFGFRLNYYPAITDAQEQDGGGRMLGHEDVDLFTILPASRQEGLQALNIKTMKWVRLKAPYGSIIVNTGDYMQRISNDRLPSTTHRVARPTDKASFATPRISLPMAVYFWEDQMLEVLPNLGEPKYQPIRSEDFHTRITSKYYGDDYKDS